MQQRARIAWVGLVLAVLIVGGLWLVDRMQADAEQRRLAQQHEDAMVFETAAAVTSIAIGGTNTARQQADDAALQATIGAQATQSVATLTAYRAYLDATVTAGQVSARATNTTLARR
jgi:hypothetical protein